MVVWPAEWHQIWSIKNNKTGKGRKALHIDDSTMEICMRIGNPLGFLLEEYSNHNEDVVSVDDLITAMNKCGLDDVSSPLLSLMNHWTIIICIVYLL